MSFIIWFTQYLIQSSNFGICGENISQGHAGDPCRNFAAFSSLNKAYAKTVVFIYSTNIKYSVIYLTFKNTEWISLNAILIRTGLSFIVDMMTM